MIDDIAIQLCFDKGEFSYPSSGEGFIHEGRIIWNQEEYIYRKYMWHYVSTDANGCITTPLKNFENNRHHVQAITVLHDFDLHEPSFVYFHAYGTSEGVWRRWDVCEKTEDGALKVYVAKGCHASYAERGRYLRVLGTKLDIARGNGRAITYRTFHPVDKSITFPDGTLKAVAMSNLPRTSLTRLTRFFLPCMRRKYRFT